MESYAGCGIEPNACPAPASFVVTLPNRNTAETTASDPGLSREENILRLMAKQGAVTRKDVEQFLGCSSFPANKALAALVEQGKIVKTGAARGTKYVLK